MSRLIIFIFILIFAPPVLSRRGEDKLWNRGKAQGKKAPKLEGEVNLSHNRGLLRCCVSVFCWMTGPCGWSGFLSLGTFGPLGPVASVGWMDG